MRIIIMTTVIVLIQLLSLGLAWAVQWLCRPFFALPFLPVAIACLIVGNAIVFGGLSLSMFRLSSNYLAILWLVFLSGIITAFVIFGLKKLGISNAYAFRGLAVGNAMGLILFAYWSAYSPTVRHLAIEIDKPMPAPVRFAVVSDLHLGRLFGKTELTKLTKILQENQVDVALMPGDIMDDDTEYFDKLKMADDFKTALNAPKFGTAMTLGNHDLYRTGAYKAINGAILDAGAILLNDETKTLIVEKDGKRTRLELVGRFDDHNHDRLPIATLLEQVDTNYPVILLDHRPSDIETHSELPIDLQVSGHTHKGQVFPANFIVDAINRVGYGHEQINGTHFLVSSGFGFWGVPFRLGSRSEVWVIEMRGQ